MGNKIKNLKKLEVGWGASANCDRLDMFVSFSFPRNPFVLFLMSKGLTVLMRKLVDVV